MPLRWRLVFEAILGFVLGVVARFRTVRAMRQGDADSGAADQRAADAAAEAAIIRQAEEKADATAKAPDDDNRDRLRRRRDGL